MNLSNFEYQENFDTSKISWIKIGNNIEYFIKIYNIKELKNLLSIIDHNIYKIFIICLVNFVLSSSVFLFINFLLKLVLI